MVESGDLDDSKAYGSKIYMIWKNSNGSLVMHFYKTVYISWFNDTELWEWLGAGPHNFRGGCFSYVPEPDYTDFQ